MKLFIVVVFLLTLAQLGRTSLMRNWMHDFENQFPIEEETEELTDSKFNGFNNFLSRSRRSNKMKMCGKSVWKIVMLTCGGECTTSNTNIATSCCESMCTMEEITGLCCPGR
uniref:IlGF domain-containing protein n=1 Tax=Caenorhabditis tropicalis TaxID=1561998 RepID=A0A1I7UA63_9PELO